jgi:hypothetical protein
MAISQYVHEPTHAPQTTSNARGVTSSLVQLLQSLTTQADEIRKDPTAAKQLYEASTALTNALQRPDLVVADLAFSGCRYACVRVGIELGLFDSLAAAQTPLTLSQLAKQCNDADPQLVRRIVRTLVGMGFAADARTADGSNAFAATAITRQMTIPSAKAGLIFHFDHSFPVIANVGPFFRQNGFKVPNGDERGVFQFTNDTDEHVYSYWSRDPKIMANFNVFMQGYFGGPAASYPTDWFPFDKVCFDGFDRARSEYVWVDIGGGKGHHSQELVERYPSASGKFVVQDRDVVLDPTDEDTALSTRVEKMPYDFFAEQPIKGARVYCLENVLHNWTDAHCSKILARVAKAMTPGYSKLIIGNMIIPDTNAPVMQCGLDASMLMVFSGGQRDKQQWSELLATAGLSVTKFWDPPRDSGDNGVIEAELKA